MSTTNPFTPSGCICPTTADLLRAALAGTEPGASCPVHPVESERRSSGRTGDPAERRRLMHLVGSGLAGMPLNASPTPSPPPSA